LDVAVLGVPNEDFGEEVKAVVQLVAGETPSTELRDALMEHCRARLSSVKCPRSIDFRTDLPRTATGKLFKRELRDEFWPKAIETKACI
jgi:acyl-coenzyme A synthetase/AMP-(fatty) acid ligase